MILVRHRTPAELADAVATALIERLTAAQARGEVPNVGLTGGTVAALVHDELGRRAAGCGVDWSRVEFWWGDERFVAPEDPDRNDRQVIDSFLRPAGVPAERLHPMPSTSDAADVEQAALDYQEEIRAHGAGFFEVVMFGMGPDGHVASLFPQHPAAEIADRIAVAVTDSPKPPPTRISLTFEAFERSRAVWLLVTGAEKAAAAARAIAESRDPGPATLPAARVHGTEETCWHLDTAAAADLAG